MTKAAAIYQFWNSFGLTAYEENTVPTDATFPYITYQLVTDSFDREIQLFKFHSILGAVVDVIAVIRKCRGSRETNPASSRADNRFIRNSCTCRVKCAQKHTSVQLEVLKCSFRDFRVFQNFPSVQSAVMNSAVMFIYFLLMRSSLSSLMF